MIRYIRLAIRNMRVALPRIYLPKYKGPGVLPRAFIGFLNYQRILISLKT